ncbi:hypothetical protein SAMN05421823_107264 [Catalinimonas alkaloidigena]|uniref:Uncharacterized protein n=1 Tax=Catalinimonas alkaloidigena TaxID=1075417 RepID=A0A1G9M4V3_9BACT|nr:hypothetical protein [Catalinimonas alkaloidigena]SDL69184.1 hypothetical protein SAMN05421823_107264 [Catalinimonas alkaloidigena]
MTLPELRQAYADATHDADAAHHLLTTLQALPQPLSAEQQAYLAATLALQARFVGNPLQKLQFANQSKKAFAEAVALDPQNPEVRLLRFAVQRAIPPFLNMSGDMEEDAHAIAQNLHKMDLNNINPTFTRPLLNFVLESGLCTKEEQATLEKARPA